MNITTDSPLYQKAFEQYLRKGTPIDISLKALMKKAAETRENHSTVLYRWRTAGDDKVRASHAANEGRIFNWDRAPATGHPGEDFNCRCMAEPVEIDASPLELLALLSGAGVARTVGVRVGGAILRRIGRGSEKPPTTKPVEPKLNDTKTWPKPPRQGRFKEGDPSRTKPRSRGEKSLYDEKGGEWRYAPKDKYHDTPHWDYKPAGKVQEWQNISLDGQRIIK